MAARTYLQFHPSRDPEALKKKTGTWHVVGANSIHLGRVAFWAHWRRYVFFPEPDKLFDASCMTQIGRFLIEQTENWKEGLKK